MRKLIIGLNILFLIIGFLSIGLALTSVMIFDSPGSENNPYVWGAFWSAVALPFTCLGSVIVSLRILFKSSNYKKALWVSLTPCIVIGIFGICLLLIQIYCQGSFSCGGKFS